VLELVFDIWYYLALWIGLLIGFIIETYKLYKTKQNQYTNIPEIDFIYNSLFWFLGVILLIIVRNNPL